jgi:hypothetical protein
MDFNEQSKQIIEVFALEVIRELIEKHPNDQELGNQVRKLFKL